MIGPARRPTTVMLPITLALSLLALGPVGCAATGSGSGTGTSATAVPEAFAEHVGGLAPRDGLLRTWLDTDRARLWLELPAPTGAGGKCVELLHLAGLETGIGSNAVGLDRGQLGEAHLIVLRRVGRRVLLERPNLAFRASTADPAEARAARESFATSVLWAGEAAAVATDGRALVDLTSLAVRDAHGIAAALKAAGEGTFELDQSRSTLSPPDCLTFPDNLELVSTLTFTSTRPGNQVSATAPDGHAVTLVQHQSLIRLPDDNYHPRDFDPRSGAFSLSFMDLAGPLDQPLQRALAIRHRLQPTNPAAASSPVRKPLVYYVDRGAPEPVRSALMDGAGWWAQAFEQAGLAGAYRVELMPVDAHPLDLRYNVIQWVHRSTRGWSYGNAISDPRTGEILKGHVSLGSLRVRQDRLLFEGLLGAEDTGSGGPDDPVQLALARIRQLAAHEVGHTLGLAHNFAASTYDDRASVMDYPAPRVRVAEDGSLDARDAYGTGVGSWDVQAIRWLYDAWPDADTERAGLAAILADGHRAGRIYVTDRDARSPGSAHPLGHLWDNGTDPVSALRETLAVREIALSSFGRRNLAPGRPTALLHEVFVPVWLHHRYQLAAAAKLVGGLDYAYELNDGMGAGAQPLAGERQREALLAVLEALEPASLDVPESVLRLLVPRPPGHPHNRELLAGTTAPAFDALGAAAVGASLVVELLLEPSRLGRLLDQHRRDVRLPGPDEVFDALITRVMGDPPGDQHERLAAVREVALRLVTDGLLALTRNTAASPGVRAEAEAALARHLGAPQASDRPAVRAVLDDVRRFLQRTRTDAAPASAPPATPPGSPIGTPAWPALTGCSRG